MVIVYSSDAAAEPSKLTMEEKRELVYEISKWPHGASEILQSWSRQEILQILCAEMGKERKYTGLTKLKIIENLLKIVSEKHSGESDVIQFSAALGHKTTKRQKKTDHPSQLPVPSSSGFIIDGGGNSKKTIYCKNSACKATLNQGDTFCRRCSCCICHQYDDNKDPSLWLSCSSERPFQGYSCGMSCHLECAMKHESSGITKKHQRETDGTFHCVSCGKLNDFLGQMKTEEGWISCVGIRLCRICPFWLVICDCSSSQVLFFVAHFQSPLYLHFTHKCWRKQLIIAKETRRVDILCYRVSLTQKLINGSEKYEKVHQLVDEAVEKLETEVGPLTGLPVKMSRGIVNRLSSGQEVQKLCASAETLLDEIIHSVSNPIKQDLNLITPNFVKFEEVQATSLTLVLGCEDMPPESTISIWHRKSFHNYYPFDPTFTLMAPDGRFIFTGLMPASDYIFKVLVYNGDKEMVRCEAQCSTSREEVNETMVMERTQSLATICSDLSNPSSMEDETNNILPDHDRDNNQADKYLSYCANNEKSVYANLSNGDTNCTETGGERKPVDKGSLLGNEHSNGTAAEFSKLEKNSSEGRLDEDMDTANGSESPVQTGMECVPFSSSEEACLPITPCKLELLKYGVVKSGRSKSNSKAKMEELQGGRSAKKRNGESQVDEYVGNGVSDRDFEYYVKVIRWLECEGHIEKNFRQKFLTWYSLRASQEEIKIVKVFVDTFIEDPSSLAEQLVDTFSESISCNKNSIVPPGFCMKLWH